MRITILTNAVIGTKMAAPGIRAYHLARVLQEQLPDARVTLAISPNTPCDIEPTRARFEIVRPSEREMFALTRSSDVMVSTKFPVKLLPAAARTRIVLDMYTPGYTEMLELSKNTQDPPYRNIWLEPRRKNTLLQFAMADLVLCANERQRDLYAGIMGTLGLIGARAYDADTSLRSVLAIAPYGVRPRPLPPRGGVKGVAPGIRSGDKLLLWNGTIIEWYDAASLIRAVHRLSRERDDVKLVFLGTEHPHSFDAGRFRGMGGGAVREAYELARALGILDTHVFFNFGWSDDATTERYLADADIGVATYFDNLETRFSFRVRFFDLIWAGLPIVSTRGDVMSEMVDRRGLGISVPERDVDTIAAALCRLATDDAFRARCRRNVEAMRASFAWEETLRPLIDYCREGAPRPALHNERLLPITRLGADWLLSESYHFMRFRLRQHLRARLARLTARSSAAR
jgi:glycosyltransferase involved in cell wall biosynthesis